MTRNTVMAVRLVRAGGGSMHEIGALGAALVVAERRARKADAGDRVDVVAFETLCSTIERLARDQRAAGAETLMIARPDPSALLGPVLRQEAAAALGVQRWINAGDVAVVLADTTTIGAVPDPTAPVAFPVASMWSAVDDLPPAEAVRARFEEQIRHVLAGDDAAAAVRPSGVGNRILTDTLRAHVEAVPGRAPVLAPVLYKDGSRARAFPLRAVHMVDPVPVRAGERRLRFALLSIRHTEMDVVVDGAWLRNTVISRRRPAADTDELVYVQSMRQLERLCSSGPLALELFQTGLDTAIIGTYRACVEFGRAHPGFLRVTPQFHRRRRIAAGYLDTFTQGREWTM